MNNLVIILLFNFEHKISYIPAKYKLLFSADQSLKSWRVDQQKCLRTVDLSPFKNEVATATTAKVNVSPPLIHTIDVLRENGNGKFLAAGCENGMIAVNKLGL